MLERGDKGELDALALLVARLGTGGAVRDVGVWVGLDPHRLEDWLAQILGIRTRRSVRVRQHAPGPAGSQSQADMSGDAVQPVMKRRPSLVSVQPPPRGQQGLLHSVVSVVQGTEHPIAVSVQRRPVLLNQSLERFGVDHLTHTSTILAAGREFLDGAMRVACS
jgi:hypothetical protein